MTRRKEFNKNLVNIGTILKSYRLDLSLPKKSREFFLSDRIEKGILEENSISLETLKNIENGKTLPSLRTLKLLSIALEVDFFTLLKDIYDLI